MIDATAAPIVTNKGSVPIGAIVGSVLGVIVVIALVLLVWLLLRRYKTKYVSVQNFESCNHLAEK